MKTLLFAVLCFACISAFAGPEGDVTKAAQGFYDGYMKVLNANQDPKKWILKSDKVASGFKKSYASFMKEPDSDPIVCGQDFPKAGFKAATDSIQGNTATVTLSSKDPAFRMTFKATFSLKDGKWLLAGTKDLTPK